MIPAFLWEAKHLRLTKAERKEVSRIARASQADGYYESEDASYDLNESLFDILDAHSLPYFYFGALLRIQSGKTKNARRPVPLTDATVDVLKRRISQAKGPFIFPFRKGFGSPDWKRPMTQLWNAHKEALQKSKIRPPFTLYDCRHTYGTRAIEGGVDPLSLMRLMGHANLATTNRYCLQRGVM